MKRLLDKQFFKSPLFRTCFVVLVLVVVFWFDVSLAQDNSVVWTSIQSSLIDDMWSFLWWLIKILSWLWIVPASLAWDLITNKLAYGSSFYFDRYLFTIWQTMRTFAYFILWFIFVWSILKIFVKQEALSKFATLLAKTVWAWVLIGASWFIMAALIDLSIVWTSAVASIPLQAMEQEFEKLEWELSCPKEIVVENSSSIEEFTVSSKWENILEFEDIMPTWDSVAWPLIFIWCGLLNFFDSWQISNESTDAVDVMLVVWLKLIMNLMLILPMLVLMVVNIMRLFFIRLWIIFWPFIVLDRLFKWPLSSTYKKYFSLSNIFWLIFQPVVVVWALSIWLLLIMGIYDVQISTDEETKAVLEQTFNIEIFEEKLARVGDDVLWEAYILWEALRWWADRAWGIIWNLLLAWFSIVILWWLVKLGFYTNAITKSTVDWMYKTTESFMKSVPLIKTRFGKLWYAWMKKAKESLYNEQMTNFEKQQLKDAGKINEILWIQDVWWSLSDWADLKGDFNNQNTSLKSMVAFRKKLEDKELNTSNKEFRSFMEQWILSNQNRLKSNNGTLFRNADYTPETIWNIWDSQDRQDTKTRRFIVWLLSQDDLETSSLNNLIRSVKHTNSSNIKWNYWWKQ